MFCQLNISYICVWYFLSYFLLKFSDVIAFWNGWYLQEADIYKKQNL